MCINYTIIQKFIYLYIIYCILFCYYQYNQPGLKDWKISRGWWFSNQELHIPHISSASHDDRRAPGVLRVSWARLMLATSVQKMKIEDYLMDNCLMVIWWSLNGNFMVIWYYRCQNLVLRLQAILWAWPFKARLNSLESIACISLGNR